MTLITPERREGEGICTEKPLTQFRDELIQNLDLNGSINFDEILNIVGNNKNLISLAVKAVLKIIKNQNLEGNTKKANELYYKLFDYFWMREKNILERIQQNMAESERNMIDLSLLPSFKEFIEETNNKNDYELLNFIEKSIPYIDEESISFYFGYLEYIENSLPDSNIKKVKYLKEKLNKFVS
ncbi:hypothetical protein [Candidatus Absconditicoccus praedator]|uniref:hypothetical protein n=1 Tax=Candidatus Absconditicoccus praedator TaxID=2735562 RepID=UPI001E5EC8A7|nr:hypothetical protein [Candidatus Absconditicoccus praedator]UFX83461.1 hypothetical protein HLG78_05015 [Candidatus Absconditicoccus praedator]